jgi:hypothetical protein
VKTRYRGLATEVAVIAVAVALLAFPVRAPTNELQVITPVPPTPDPIVMLGVPGTQAIFDATAEFKKTPVFPAPVAKHRNRSEVDCVLAIVTAVATLAVPLRFGQLIVFTFRIPAVFPMVIVADPALNFS